MQQLTSSNQPKLPAAQDAPRTGGLQRDSPRDSHRLPNPSEKQFIYVCKTEKGSFGSNSTDSRRHSHPLQLLLLYLRRVWDLASVFFDKLIGVFGHVWHLASKHREDHWTLELVSCFGAVACLIAIIGILRTHQGIPLPLWPSWLTINTVVSILTVTLKASIVLAVGEAISQLKWHWFHDYHALSDMEDFAIAKEPWGALLFLLMFWRKNPFASSGALLIFLAVAIEPFSQQLVYYYSCETEALGSSAYIARTNNYTAGGIFVSHGNADLSPDISVSLYQAGLETTPKNGTNVEVLCPSGNCTFPADNGATLTTLGMCYSCSDIADLIRPNTSYPGGWWLQNWTPDPSWNWWDNDARVGWLAGPMYENLSYYILQSRKTLAFNHDFDDLITLDFLWLNVADNCTTTDGAGCDFVPWAARCSLYPCVKTVSSEVNNGALAEVVLETIPLRKNNISGIEVTTSENLTWAIAVNRTIQNGRWRTCIPADSESLETPVPISANLTLPLYPNETAYWYPAECVYTLDYLTNLGINQQLSAMYDGTPLRALKLDTVRNRGYAWLKTFYRNGRANLASANTYFAAMADALTGVMRSGGDSPPSDYTYGVELTAQTCVGVQWVWISFPALLVVSALGFTAVVAIWSRGQWNGAWRSFSLAMFFHDVEGGKRDTWSGLDRPSKMHQAAESIQVALSKESGKFVLRPEPFSRASDGGGSKSVTNSSPLGQH